MIAILSVSFRNQSCRGKRSARLSETATAKLSRRKASAFKFILTILSTIIMALL